MEINENTKIEFLFRKNDGEEMSFILTLAQLEGSEPNFYKQAKKMMDGKFDLEDMLAQMEQINRLGSLTKLMKFIPGMPKISSEISSVVRIPAVPEYSSKTTAMLS